MTPERLAELRALLEERRLLKPWAQNDWPDSTVEELLAEVDRLKAECDEWQLSFDLFETAVHRGTEMWREANPGNELVLPSTDKLVLWLIHTLDQHRRVVEAAPCRVCEARHLANEGVTFWSCSCPEPRPMCAECFGILRTQASAGETGPHKHSYEPVHAGDGTCDMQCTICGHVQSTDEKIRAAQDALQESACES